MTCYHPNRAYKLRKKNPKTGKNIIVFHPRLGIKEHLSLACGQCVGCRLERSRIWAIRCMHEAELHENNQYVTLTYNDKNLPENRSLHKPDLQKFFKRLRKRHGKLRYYACGEYGEKYKRPHYHAIIYGLELNDKIHSCTNNGFKLYTSASLEKTWGHGNVLVGDVSFESCAYVARYIMKKQLGKDAYLNYMDVDTETGLVTNERIPEFTTMSLRDGGIGLPWFKKHKKDLYQYGTDGVLIIRGGIHTSPPRYYEQKFMEESESNLETVNIIKERRKREAIKRWPDNTRQRLLAKERVATSKTSLLKRQLEQK